MENIEKLAHTSMAEIERLLSTKSVVGEPIAIDGTTLVPLISVGFGFGAGGTAGRPEKEAKGQNAKGGTGGAGGGGNVRPVAVVIVSKDGVNVARIGNGGAATTAVEKVGDIIVKAIETRAEKKPEA
jgi:uncharacterized spore protein YtfJ